jgi:hypothetical protein
VASTEPRDAHPPLPGTFATPKLFADYLQAGAASAVEVLPVAESENPLNALQESVPAAEAPAITSLLSFQIGVVVIAALYLAREVLVPITAAILLSFVLAPHVDLLRRWRLGRVPSVLIAVFVAIAIIGAIGTVIGSQVAQLAPRAPEYAGTIEKKIEAARTYLAEKASGLLQRVGYDATPVQTVPQGSAGAETPVKGDQPGSNQRRRARSSYSKVSVPYPVAVRNTGNCPRDLDLRAAAEGGSARSDDPGVRCHGPPSDDGGA